MPLPRTPTQRRRKAPRSQSSTCESLAEFVANVDRASRDWTPKDVEWYLQPWFRGHADAGWSLTPGWYRQQRVRGLGAEFYNEQELLDGFKLRAPMYLERLPRTDWEWLFLMQHYGLPTRLLDWTESALVALYFAVGDHQGGADAAVWAMNPWWINKQALGGFELFTAESPRAANWAPGKLKAGIARAPIAVRPSYESSRIQAQHGVFTIHGADPGGVEALADLDDCQIRKLVLPARSVGNIRRELSVAGISESAVFPELAGLCRELRRFFFGA
jgi:FRG domain